MRERDTLSTAPVCPECGRPLDGWNREKLAAMFEHWNPDPDPEPDGFDREKLAEMFEKLPRDAL